jgi:predicted ATPase
MTRESSYVSLLGSVLRQRSPERLRRFLVGSAVRFGDERQLAEVQAKTDAEMEELLHRMIVARPDLMDLHRSSREWLFRHGIDTFGEAGERRN